MNSLDGFVVIQVNAPEDKDLYWSGNLFVEDIQNAGFYASLTDARRVGGQLQGQLFEKEIKISPAKLSITLVS